MGIEDVVNYSSTAKDAETQEPKQPRAAKRSRQNESLWSEAQNEAVMGN